MLAEIPASIPPKLRDTKRNQQNRISPQWMRTLVAILVVGVLIGSFVTLLNLRRLGLNTINTPTVTVTPACKPYPLKLFDVPYHTTADSINVLEAVTAVSANDAWAVGSSTDILSFSISPLIEHWNGRSWQFVPGPNITNGSGVLATVAATSASDVWTVGSSLHGSIPSNKSWSSASETLVERWDGKVWRIIASPNGPAGNGILNALTAISQNDVWAVACSFAKKKILCIITACPTAYSRGLCVYAAILCAMALVVLAVIVEEMGFVVSYVFLCLLL